MTNPSILSSSTYEQELFQIVRQLSPDRVLQLLNFARSVQAQTLADLSASPEQESYEETEAEILADEAHWDTQFATTQDGLKQMAATVRAEIQAGRTLPIAYGSSESVKPNRFIQCEWVQATVR
jgi:hypothetical protein